MFIATHTSPDLDAVTSCWLLQRYGGLAEAAVVFVNTGTPDPEVLASAAAVVDTGRVYDPGKLRFDHHQHADLPSATALVGLAVAVPACIRPIVDLVDAGDLGHADAAASRQMGLHAIYAGGRPEGDDAGSLAYGYALLDALALTLERRDAGRQALASCVAWKSADGLVWALRNGPRAASSAAFEQGARLVVFADYETNAIGVQRAAEWQQPHVGELVTGALWEVEPTSDLATELERWFRHPAGFFAGSGTAKAPRPEPIEVDVAVVAELLSATWER